MPYKAFISYSHETDAVTSALQSALHNFAKPWYRVRALHVFRDQTSLAANPGLAASLESAMRGCEYLLLVATPQSAQSVWVKWEIACWLKEHSVERILILLAGGEVVWNREQQDFDWDRTTSLPEELKARFPQEPVYVDLRWTAKAGEVLSLKNPRFREAILNIAAPLHGKSKDEMDGEDLRQFRRTRIIALAVICAMVITIAVAGRQSFLSAQRQKALIAAGSNVAQEKNVANSRAIAAEANLHLKDDPELSLLLADEAAKNAQTAEAEDALRRALTESRLRASLGDSHTRILSAAFSPDSKLLVTRGDKGRIQIWEAPNWTQKAELPNTEGRIDWASFSPDSKYLVTAGIDANPKIWDASDWKVEAELKGHGSWVHSAEFSPDSRLVATAGQDRTVRLWNVHSGTNIATLEGHTGVVVGALFSPDSKRLLTIADEENDKHPTRLWDVSTYKPVAYLEGTIPNFEIPVFTPTSVFSYDGKLVATVANQEIWVWSTDHGRLVTTLKLKGAGRVWEASFSPIANLLALRIMTAWHAYGTWAQRGR